MPETKTIVCLANSFRPGGNCVAGREYENGQFGAWVRPISHRSNHAINDLEVTCSNGQRSKVLDILEIQLDSHQPMGHQSENWLITQGVRWEKVGELNAGQLAGAVQAPPAQLWNSSQSTREGQGDLVGGFFIHATTDSLTLIQPDLAIVEVCENEYNPERKNIWVSFQWAGRQYRLKLTDPVYFAAFENGGHRRYQLESPMICISLAEIWPERGTASKLVAGLIT
jgi:hypothetical protein